MINEFKIYSCYYSNPAVGHIFEPFSYDEDGRPIGNVADINFFDTERSNCEGTYDKSINTSFDWYNNRWNLREATPSEKDWLLTSRAAGRLTKKPKELTLFPIY